MVCFFCNEPIEGQVFHALIADVAVVPLCIDHIVEARARYGEVRLITDEEARMLTGGRGDKIHKCCTRPVFCFDCPFNIFGCKCNAVVGSESTSRPGSQLQDLLE